MYNVPSTTQYIGNAQQMSIIITTMTTSPVRKAEGVGYIMRRIA